MARKNALLLLTFVAFSFPLVSSAAALTSTQVNAIIQLLVAFNVDAITIAKIETQLRPQSEVATVQPSSPMPPAQMPPSLVTTAPPAPQPIVPLEPTPIILIDRIPPQIVRHNRSIGGNNVSWPDPNFPGYGNTHKSCTDCLLIVSDEPTKIVVTYFDYDDVTANLSSENKVLWGES